jgi:hypothetical protein
VERDNEVTIKADVVIEVDVEDEVVAGEAEAVVDHEDTRRSWTSNSECIASGASLAYMDGQKDTLRWRSWNTTKAIMLKMA